MYSYRLLLYFKMKPWHHYACGSKVYKTLTLRLFLEPSVWTVDRLYIQLENPFCF